MATLYAKKTHVTDVRLLKEYTYEAIADVNFEREADVMCAFAVNYKGDPVTQEVHDKYMPTLPIDTCIGFKCPETNVQTAIFVTQFKPNTVNRTRCLLQRTWKHFQTMAKMTSKTSTPYTFFGEDARSILIPLNVRSWKSSEYGKRVQAARGTDGFFEWSIPKDNKELNKEATLLDKANATIESLRNELSDVRTSQKWLERKLKYRDYELADANAEIEQLQKKLKTMS